MDTLFEVEVVADYSARSAAELSLVKGTTMRVMGVDPSGLWAQSKNTEGKVGWLPLSYTKMSTPPAQPPKNLPDTRPLPAKQTIEKYRTKPPCSLLVHVIRGRLEEAGKGNVSVVICRRNVLSEERRVLFHTERKKVVCPLEWNEEFVIFVQDPEVEVLSLALLNGSTFKSKVLGEIDIPLRGAVRNFDKPKGKLQWLGLHNKDHKKIGELLVFLEFEDTRVTERPRDFQHTTHIGLTSTGEFETRQVPPQFKAIVRHLQIKTMLNATSSTAPQEGQNTWTSPIVPVSVFQVQNSVEQNEDPTTVPALPIQHPTQIEISSIAPQCGSQSIQHGDQMDTTPLPIHTQTETTKDWDVQGSSMDCSGPLLNCRENVVNMHGDSDQCEISFIDQIQKASHHLKKTEVQKQPPSMNGLLKEAFTRTRPLITGNKLDSDEEWSDSD